MARSMLIAIGMSEAAAEKKEEAAPAAGGGGNKKLLIIALAVNVLLAGGLGYVVVSGKQHAAEEAKKQAHGKKAEGEHGEHEGAEGEHAEEGEEEEEEEEEGGGDHGGHGKSAFGPLVEVGSFIANLASGPGEPPRYAKVAVHVEALNEEAKGRVEGAVVPIKAEALMLISNAKPEDVIGAEKVNALSATLLKRANKLIGKKSIKRVYFSELVIQ